MHHSRLALHSKGPLVFVHWTYGLGCVCIVGSCYRSLPCKEPQHFFKLVAKALAVDFAPPHFMLLRFKSFQDSHHPRMYPVITASADNSSDFIRVFVVHLRTLDELAFLILPYCFSCAEPTQMQISGDSEFGSHRHWDHAGLYFSSMSHKEELADMLGNESLTCRCDRAKPPAFLLKTPFRLSCLACVSTPSSVDCPLVWLSLLQVSWTLGSGYRSHPVACSGGRSLPSAGLGCYFHQTLRWDATCS